MNFDLVFNFAFFCQVVAVSALLPWHIRVRARQVMDAHPQLEYPRLYPQSREWYDKALSVYLLLNAISGVIGLFFWMTYNLDATNDDYAGVVWAVFMIQQIPYLYLEVKAMKTWRLMREADDRRQRSASLQPKRLRDVIDPLHVVSLSILFLGMCGLIAYIDQFEYPWFGGWLNALMLAGTYVFMLGVVGWRLYSRNRDPYLDDTVHLQRVRHLASQLMLLCHAVTLYAMVVISLQAFALNELKQLAMTIYCLTLVLGYYLIVLRDGSINFEHYRRLPIAG